MRLGRLASRLRQALPTTYADVDRIVGSAQVTRRVMNVWPPFLFSSIRIVEVADDFHRVVVRLSHRRLTANYVGTLYGGSLFSMTDPFWMMMLTRSLGREYTVWDVRGEIDFLAPGRGDATATFELDPVTLSEIRAETADGAKHLRWFETEIVGSEGSILARVRKQVYVRRRRQS